MFRHYYYNENSTITNPQTNLRHCGQEKKHSYMLATRRRSTKKDLGHGRSPPIDMIIDKRKHEFESRDILKKVNSEFSRNIEEALHHWRQDKINKRPKKIVNEHKKSKIVNNWTDRLCTHLWTCFHNNIPAYLHWQRNIVHCVNISGPPFIKHNFSDEQIRGMDLRHIEQRVIHHYASQNSENIQETPIWNDEIKQKHIIMAFGSLDQSGVHNAIAITKRCPLCGQITSFRPDDTGGGRADDGTKLKFKCSTPSCRGHEF